MSYCTLADLKNYLNITGTGDDGLLQRMLDAASARIDSQTGKTFQAAIDATRVIDPGLWIGGEWWFDAPLSHITAVTNGDGTDVTAKVITRPRLVTPWYAMRATTANGGISWTNTDDEPLTVTGRWAWMERYPVTAIARADGYVTATVAAPGVGPYSQVYTVGFADGTFNGQFTVASSSPLAISWYQAGADDTDTTGWILTPPADIVTACRRLAAWMYRQKDTQQGDQDRPLLAGDGTVIMPTTLPHDVEKLLQPYTSLL